jgi:ribosome-associated translation inhibitor RaiA/cold shock CspA family protein
MQEFACMDKPLQIVFKDTASSEFLEKLIRQRASRLERKHAHIIGCRVVVDVPHRSPESGKPPLSVAVEIDVPNKRTIVGKDEQERREMKNDHYAVVNRAFDAAERQLKSTTQILRHDVKHHEGGSVTGQVVRLFPEQGYGFVEISGSTDLYFAQDVANGGFENLKVGSMVEVTRATVDGPMGPQASSVKLRAN